MLEDNEGMKINKEAAEDSKSEIDNDDKSETHWTPSTKKLPNSLFISQFELHDLLLNLGLPKDGSEFLAPCLKKKNPKGTQKKSITIL